MSPAQIISLVLTSINISSGVSLELSNGDFHMKAMLKPKRWHPTSGVILYTTPEGINCHGNFHMDLRAKEAIIEFDSADDPDKSSLCQTYSLLVKVGMHSKEYPAFLGGKPTEATYMHTCNSGDEQKGTLRLVPRGSK